MTSANYAELKTEANPHSAGTAGNVAGSAAPHAFVVGEDFAGMRSQALGLMERAGWRGVFCPVRPDRMARLALGGPRWLGQSFMRDQDGQDLLGNLALAASDVVISVGGKGGAVGAALRNMGRPVVQVQNPRQRLSRFDLIVACRHDDISGPNVLLGRTAVHGLTPEILTEARRVWEPRFAHLPRPLTVALVGGANGRFRFGEAEGRRLGQVLAQTVRNQGGSLVITPSRRTDPAARQALDDCTRDVGGQIWDGTGENPYIGLIACADNLVVTIDSVSMMSEAVAGHAPVTVFPLPGRSRRISSFVEELELSGRVRVLNDVHDHLPDPWETGPLDDTPELVEEIHRRLGF
ncbi:mitochondrial fission ELM1 family protein [Acetobacter sp.]|uniref:mitochondrial fission ELM1 family protein n=1 Tax=Acetobacter sp. TaxID=440 RepID=UPI0039ECC573